MTDLTREQIEQCTYPIGDCVCRAAEAKNIALTKAIENLKECLDQAEAKVEALRVDAERYRWLADSNNYEESVKLISANLTEYQLDAAIDEARGVKP